jgi:hypothetical protein
MPAKPNTRNWNDVQTAIAAVAIVGTLGLWNVFAAPVEKASAAGDDPVVPPTEPPVAETPIAVMPQVKIMFTQAAPQTIVVQQPQEQQKKKKKNNNNGNNNGGGSVTQTRSS